MKLFLEKSKCKIREGINGRIWEINTDDVVYIEDGSHSILLHPDSSEFYSSSVEGPFLTPAPKEYSI